MTPDSTRNPQSKLPASFSIDPKDEALKLFVPGYFEAKLATNRVPKAVKDTQSALKHFRNLLGAALTNRLQKTAAVSDPLAEAFAHVFLEKVAKEVPAATLLNALTGSRLKALRQAETVAKGVADSPTGKAPGGGVWASIRDWVGKGARQSKADAAHTAVLAKLEEEQSRVGRARKGVAGSVLLGAGVAGMAGATAMYLKKKKSEQPAAYAAQSPEW